MKIRPLALLFLVALSTPARAQVDAGFLKVVNLISLESPTYIRLGSFAFDDGRAIPAGDNSGMLALKPDKYTLTVSNEGAKPASASIATEIENGRNVVVMCYDELVEKRDGEMEAKLEFAVLEEIPALDSPRLSIVSLLREPTTPVRIDGETVVLTDRRAHRLEPKINSEVSLQVEKTTLDAIEITKPIHYIAFLYRDPEDGGIALSLIQNEKLEYRPPLPDEESTAE